MLGVILRRLLGGLFVLWVVHLATFAALRALPGDAWADVAGDRALPPQAMAELRARYGADRPLAVQYFDDLGARLRLDFGHSLKLARGERVDALLLRAAPVSFGLGCGALLLGLGLGLWAGARAARRRGRLDDRLVLAGASLGVSVPDFVLGTALLVAFPLALGWLPPGGLESPWGLVLPVVTLAVPLAAGAARLARSTLADELRAGYVRTARAKGAAEGRVVVDHALRPASGPVLAWSAQAAANLLTGSMVVETLFAIPGLGFYFVAGAMQRDWPVVTGAALAYAALLVVFNLVADLLMAWLDPRTR
jgi:oligopeptide transport system permease protein